jgi:radical SAM superfamily enzyme YgiQ (UPF0313 family)
MKRPYPNKDIDVCLIATSEVDLGIRSLSSFLKEKGYRVVLGLFGSLGSDRRDELESIHAWIQEMNPKVVGITSLEYSRETAVGLIGALRGAGRVVVAGGPDVTANPEYYIDHADYLIRGEGEQALAEFVDAVLTGKERTDILNLCFRGHDGKMVQNKMRPLIQNLDEIPYEDWLDVEHHFELQGSEVRQKQDYAVLGLGGHTQDRERSIFIYTIRGCSFKCSFCMNSQLRQLYPDEKYVRKRSIESVIARVEQLMIQKASNVTVYFFEDDFFARTSDEISHFCEEWGKRIDLPFVVYGSPLNITEEKLKQLVGAGLILVQMGIQSGSERTNYDIYERAIGNEATINTVNMIEKYIQKGRFKMKYPSYEFIINNPYEDENDLKRTIRLIEAMKKPYYAHMLSLECFQGSKLYERAVKDGKISGRDETTRYDINDTLRHFDSLVKRGGNYYLNSLIYWMNGYHTKGRCGIVPAKMLGLLTWKGTIWMFNRNPWLISFLNYVLPTNRRVSNIEQKFKRYLSRHLDTVAGVIVRTNEAALSEQRH